MSDYEEPAAKMSKIEMAHKVLEEELDEGHEEWLSEGILTDDDYNPAADQESHINTSQEDTTPSLPDTADTSNPDNVNTQEAGTTNTNSEKIEKTLENLESLNQTEFPEELGAFLIRKTDGKVIDPKKDESELDESTKHSDDGHDTDELLRMLGEDDSIKKEVKKVDQKNAQVSQSSDDDEYIFEGAKVARLKVAKKVIMKKYPSKAVPEEVSDRDGDSDMSSDEGLTVKRMFGVSRKANIASKSTARPVTRKVVGGQKYNAPEKVPTKVTSTPLPKATPLPKTQVITKTHKVKRPEPEEIINEEEFLEDEQFDLDEDLGSSVDGEGEMEGGLRLMRPERMDEDAPSDPDSHSDDDDSLYDELPSSESDDLNEWFALDVRAERAGDYIPLLGSKAHQLLMAEKQRVTARLSNLKQSMTTLTENSSQQAEMLRRATLQLAELDAALKA